MSGIYNKVSIIGMGCTKFGERFDASREDLVLEAVQEEQNPVVVHKL